MRKILLGTTAMVAAGLVSGHAQAADPISLQLGGYYRVAYYGIIDDTDGAANCGAGGNTVDRTCTTTTNATAQTGVLGTGAATSAEPGFNRRQNSFSTDGEVFFNGSTTLDNGIGVAVRIELEVLDNSGALGATGRDIIDEHYITLSGGFGNVGLGVDDTIGNSFSTTAPVGAGLFGVNSPGFVASNIGNAGPGSNTTVVTLGGDAAGIRYQTPSFAGFRLGLSYHPDVSDTANLEEVDLGADGTVGQADGLGSLYGVAASYSGTFGDIGVNWSAAFAHAENDDDPQQCTGFGYGGGCTDVSEWQTGLNVSFLGFTIGGSFRHGENVGGVRGDTADVWDAGVAYSTGPVTVGLSMSQGSYNMKAVADGGNGIAPTNGTTGAALTGGAAAGTLTVIQLGATYALGPGVSLQGAVTWDEFDSRQGTNVPSNGSDARTVNSADYRSWAGGLALGLSF